MSYRNPDPYIPRNIGEIQDFLGSMMLSAPTLEDETGYFPDRNISTEFFALNEGLKALESQLGPEKYRKLAALSAQMRAHFEADPQDNTGEASKGRKCIVEMQDILRTIAR